MTQSRPLFSAEGVGKWFGDRQVLKSASLWAWPSRITAVFGRNGSGKTTLFRCAMGITALDHGVVHYDGESFLRPKLSRLARRGLMFIPAEGALARGRIVEDQIEGLAWRFRTGRRTAEVAASLGLTHLLRSTTDELSGGEQRRASIAAAVCRAPKCLLIDEPFAGVAPTDAELIASALGRLAAAGCAILLTGHDVDTVLSVSDDVIWMSAGTTHGLGSGEDALMHDQFRREYLAPNQRAARP